jgi:hypothetical protein
VFGDLNRIEPGSERIHHVSGLKNGANNVDDVEAPMLALLNRPGWGVFIYSNASGAAAL